VCDGQWGARRSVVNSTLARSLETRGPLSLSLDANSHRAPDATKLSRPCRVRFDGVNWIPDNSEDCRRPTERTKCEHVHSDRPVSSHRHDRDRTILSCLAAGVNRASQSPGSSRSRTVRRLSASPTGSDVIGQPGHVIVVVVERKQYLLFVGHVLSL